MREPIWFTLKRIELAVPVGRNLPDLFAAIPVRSLPKSADKGGEKKIDVEKSGAHERTRGDAGFRGLVSSFCARFSTARPNPAGDLMAP